MRRRLCYLALLLVPLCVFGPVVLGEFGTPSDLVQLGTGGSDAGAPGSFLAQSLVDVSFHWVGTVPALSLVRGLGLFLVILGGVALWQILERGGWGEIDAAALTIAVVLLPTAQVIVAQATAWPVALAALLALAGFAATESELEMGGTRRAIGLVGGALLYFGAAMCDFSGALLALVPLAALTLSKPTKALSGLGRWYFTHGAILAAGLTLAVCAEIWMLHGAGVGGRSALVERGAEIAWFALPTAGSGFWVAEGGWSLGLRWGMTAVLVSVVVLLVRRDGRRAEGLSRLWLLALTGPVLFALVAPLFAANYTGGFLSLWALGGLLLVGLIGGLRGAGESGRKRGAIDLAALGGIVAVGLLAAHVQGRAAFVDPLERDWERMRGHVMRAKFAGEVKVQVLIVDAESSGRGEHRLTRVVGESGEAAVQIFHAALRERFTGGLPKGAKVTAEAVRTASPGAMVFDLR